MNEHLARLVERHGELDGCKEDILAAFEMLRDCFAAGGKALFCGNGGSAADCEHWCAELLKGFEKRRPLSGTAGGKLPPALSGSLQGALPAIPLTGFISLSSAFANDVDPKLVFAQLAWGLGRKGDILVGISTSGNAENVRLALEAARAKGMKTIGLTGEAGGEVGQIAHVTIRAPGERTCEVQELHLPVYHCLCLMLEDEFFGGTSGTQNHFS
ncbi:MAG: D-sedoheptulose-7-phosphate isomerase [Planctomycetota bacterium]|jgi:D-sedoheptulose 7-phosphate isomerase